MLYRFFQVPTMIKKRKKNFFKKPELFKLEFCNLSTIGILSWLILCCGNALCIVGCSAASLGSTHQMPVAHLQLWEKKKKKSPDICQMSPGEQNYPS